MIIDKIIVELNNIVSKYNNKFQAIFSYLTNNVLKSNIELNISRLMKPYYDSQILVQYLMLQSYKYRFVLLCNKLFRKIYFINF